MSNSPYSPPESEVSDPPPPAGSPVKAVLVGLAIDIGGSMLLGLVLVFIQALVLASTGMVESEIEQAVMNPEPWVHVAGSLIGGVLSAFAGFVCASISRRTDYKLGFILGGLSTLLGFSMAYTSYSLPANLGLAVLTFGCVLLGTHLGRARN